MIIFTILAIITFIGVIIEWVEELRGADTRPTQRKEVSDNEDDEDRGGVSLPFSPIREIKLREVIIKEKVPKRDLREEFKLWKESDLRYQKIRRFLVN